MQRKQFARMNSVVDNLEAVLIDATKVKGWKWAQQEPLWVTWSLEKFGEYFLDSFNTGRPQRLSNPSHSRPSSAQTIPPIACLPR